MKTYTHLTKNIQDRPIHSGLFGVALVILMGVGIGSAFGFSNPTPAAAQFAPEITVTGISTIPVSVPTIPISIISVPPFIPVIPPPIISIVPVTLPPVPAETPAAQTTDSGKSDTIVVTGTAANTTDSGTPLVSTPATTPAPVVTPAATPAKEKDIVVNGTKSTDTSSQEHEIVVTGKAPETIIQTPPCCTVPNTAVSTPVVNNLPAANGEIVVTGKAPETVIQTPPCCTTPSTPNTIPLIPVTPEITVTANKPETIIQTPPCCTLPSTPSNPLPVPVPVPPVTPVTPVTPPVVPPVIIPPVIVPPVIIPPVIVPPVIIPPPVIPAPQCTLIAGPTTIQQGGNSVLTFTTAQATSFIINNGIGSLTPVASGTITVIPNTTTTYTGTATGPGGQITCNATVTVVPPTTVIVPACVLTASATIINGGDSVTLSYSGTNITGVTIDNGALASTTTTSGTVAVKPTTNTTYTGSFTTTNGTTLICTAPVTINTGGGGGGGGGGTTSGGGTSSGGGTTSGGGRSGGGGFGSPTVTLTSRVIAPLGAVYLSQIPYTGLDLGPVGTAVYWLTLIIWSLAAAYLVLFGALPMLRRKAVAFGGNVRDAMHGEEPLLLPEHAQASARAVAMPAVHAPASIQAPAPLYTVAPAPVAIEAVHQAAHAAAVASAMPAQAPAAPAARQTGNGFKSFATGGALSIDDIVKGLSRESGMVFSTPTGSTPAPEAHTPTPDVTEQPEVVEHAEPEFVAPAPQAAPAPAKTEQVSVAQAPTPAPAAPSFATPTPAPQAPMAPAPVAAEVPGFVSAILNGERDQVFMIIRQMNQAGHDVEAFVSHAILALDDAYRGRIDGTPVHPDMKRVTDHLATSFLEKFVTSLTTAIDGSYSMGVTGLKIALTRALAVAQG